MTKNFKRLTPFLLFFVLIVVLFGIFLGNCINTTTYKLNDIGDVDKITKEIYDIQATIHVRRTKDGVTFNESIKNTGNETVTVTHDKPLGSIKITSTDGTIFRKLDDETENRTINRVTLKPNETFGAMIVRLPNGSYHVTTTFYLKINERHVNIPIDFILKIG